jgi:nucleoside-triphosphatase
VHIFLTGNIQVGKSTIIRKYLSQTGYSADGFITYWKTEKEGIRKLYISPYCPDRWPEEKYMLAQIRNDQRILSENIVDTFDTRGSGILDSSGRCDVIVMDELGFIESKAFVFQQAVMMRISGDIPVLGVIKSIRNEFPDRIRNHPKVQVREVTVENRDATLEWLLGLELCHI